MTQALAEILKEVDQLSVDERAELADHLVVRLAADITPSLEQEHLTDVKSRITGVESGAISLISGADGLAQVRRSIGQIG